MPLLLLRFLAAVQYLTRLPVPRGLPNSNDQLARASAFFPLVGVIVGGGAALVFVALERVLPLSGAVLGAIIFAAFLTNGLHEDGLGDAFDGFGGGWTKEQIIEIMRDSRIGTYGTLALIFLVLGKFTLLSSLTTTQTWRWLIVAHTAARWTTLPLSAFLPYAGGAGQGRLVAKLIGPLEIVFGTITLLLVLLLLPWQAALVAFLVSVLVTFVAGLYFRSRLAGVTGDCFGAANQLTEIALYLTAVVLLRFEWLT